MTTYPFRPTGPRFDLAATTSSARTLLPPQASPYNSVRVTTPTGADAYLAFGDATVTASTATGMNLIPGSAENFQVPPGATHVAIIAGSGTPTIMVVPGLGM